MVNIKKPSAKAPAAKKKHESSDDDRQHKKRKSTNRFEDSSEDSDFRAAEVSAPPRAGGETEGCLVDFLTCPQLTNGLTGVFLC